MNTGIAFWKTKRKTRIQWGCSSVGRAPALQAGGQEFESLHLHSVRNIKLCNWPEPKAFDINADWYRSFEETSNGFALRRLCTLKTSYRDKYWEKYLWKHLFNQDIRENKYPNVNIVEKLITSFLKSRPHFKRYWNGKTGQATKSAGWMPWH